MEKSFPFFFILAYHTVFTGLSMNGITDDNWCCLMIITRAIFNSFRNWCRDYIPTGNHFCQMVFTACRTWQQLWFKQCNVIQSPPTAITKISGAWWCHEGQAGEKSCGKTRHWGDAELHLEQETRHFLRFLFSKNTLISFLVFAQERAVSTLSQRREEKKKLQYWYHHFSGLFHSSRHYWHPHCLVGHGKHEIFSLFCLVERM